MGWLQHRLDEYPDSVHRGKTCTLTATSIVTSTSAAVIAQASVSTARIAESVLSTVTAATVAPQANAISATAGTAYASTYGAACSAPLGLSGVI